MGARVGGRKGSNLRPWECLLCGKPVSSPVVLGRGKERLTAHEIGEAVHFFSPGNWASGVWDPLDENMRLEIVICDECLRPLLKRALVVRWREEYVEHERTPFPAWLRRVGKWHEQRVARIKADAESTLRRVERCQKRAGQKRG